MMSYRKVKDHPELIKDEESKAVLNTDVTALDAYRKRRQQNRSVQTMCDDLNNLKSEMTEIKSMLKEIINNHTTN